MVSRISILALLFLCCGACISIHTKEYDDARAEAYEYLRSLTGDRFDEVMDDQNLYPLFNIEASYGEAVRAARRAVRWRIEVAGGKVESGAINLGMVLSGLLGRKPRVDADE